MPNSPNFHYPHAPIEEIAIDIQVVGVDDDRIEMLEGIKYAMPRLERAEPITVAEFRLNVATPQDATLTASGQVGWKLSAPAASRVLQATLSAFTYSHTKPYTAWPEFVRTAQAIWPAYRDAASPKSVRRVGLRTINRISIPIETITLEDYFNCAPRQIKALDDLGIGGFFTQLQFKIDQVEEGAFLLLNFASAEGLGLTGCNFLLDIDLFVERPMAIDNDEAWRVIQKFGEYKSRIFEACITEKTRELFQ